MRSITGRPPAIDGSWGYATAEERAEQGLSSGGPSNKHGHIHVLDFGLSRNTEISVDGTAAERLNHFAPWEALICKKIGVPLARAMQESFAQSVDKACVSIERFSEDSLYDGARSAYTNGYQISFSEEVSFEVAFNALATLCTTLSTFYRETQLLFEYYHTQCDASDEANAVSADLKRLASNIGFLPVEAEAFSEFVLRIKPTYTQLMRWQARSTISSGAKERIANQVVRYERARSFVDKLAKTAPLTAGIIRDTLRPHTEWNEIQGTWPVHFAGFFAPKDFILLEDELSVKSMVIVPKVGSNETSEHLYGGIFRRATAANNAG